MSLPRAKGLAVICVVIAAAAVTTGLGKLDSNPKPAAVSKKDPTHLLAAHVDASVKAFDSANTISDPNWFVQAYAAGFRLYVLNTVQWGTCNPWSQAQSQIAAALAAGLKIAAYTRNPGCWQNGILATGPYQSQLQFFALDVETNPGIAATPVMVDGIKALGVRPIIYGSSRTWAKIEGKLAGSFSNLPLWDTNISVFPYDTWHANYLSPTPIAFGGWNTQSNMRVGVQQQIEYPLNGINVDLNSFDASFLR